MVLGVPILKHFRVIIHADYEVSGQDQLGRLILDVLEGVSLQVVVFRGPF